MAHIFLFLEEHPTGVFMGLFIIVNHIRELWSSIVIIMSHAGQMKVFQ